MRCRDNHYLVAAPAVACIADVTMTLIGQPAAYWTGDHSAVTDFNPIVRWLLQTNPAAFPIVAALGLIVLAVILLSWPNRSLAYVLAFCVTFAQSVAAGGWMIRYGLGGCASAIALLIISERLLAKVRPEHGVAAAPPATPS